MNKEITPWNPCQRAIARVLNPLPAPKRCPDCGAKVEIVNHTAIYGKAYSEWPWAYRCTATWKCDSRVGMHPQTNIPLGALANRETRAARMQAKDAFNPLWQSKRMTRSEAYAWLAKQLSIAKVESCHIGWFDVKTCQRVVKVCRAYKPI
ncbi:zinc-finger-containing protein [Noviherbaspirillum pedocola]|uniref:Uncharacterized protein n=1 Tax=Noviherbaspirillum pedocola TaxID=2801341 RepID=A0A934W760_9BURK|nr:zinc-finger-containing protein [Noviherbaspirillum pedocola]MBK4735985.1 hypothetical protein [Noviherbaspirillum pedocola]